MKPLGEKSIEFHIDKAIRAAERKVEVAQSELDQLLTTKEKVEKFTKNVEEFVGNQVEEKVAELDRLINDRNGTTQKIEAGQVALCRAKTFAIIDTILFTIENWASDDSPAPDITLASQATIFPVFLQAAGQGDENYYLTEVPASAALVVERGREFVRKFREEEHISVLDPTGWAVLQPVLHKWWTRDAMPLLYGAGYEGWEFEEPYTLEQMMTWRDREMSRALDFPVIFDGYELVRKYGDEIREETGLPAFSRQMLKSRIKAHG